MKYTQTQSFDQILVLSRLIEKPMRYSELWKDVRIHIKSKETLGHVLHALEKDRVIERDEKSRREVIYKIAENPDKQALETLMLARRVSKWGSIELIADVIDYLLESSIFSSDEERMQAAIDFWVERYRNLCVLDALFSIARNQNDITALKLRKLYQLNEDKFFDILLRFKKKKPRLYAEVLEKKLLFKGIDLKPSWISMKLDQFLKMYYPKAYETAKDKVASEIYFTLLEREREKEYFYCIKNKKEYPQWICRFCKLRKVSSASRTAHCKYQKIQSLTEKILAKRKSWSQKMQT
jgi:DNA-binding HxlR family transcriptional regulator